MAGAGVAGMVASGAAMATGVGLVAGAVGMATSASAAAMGVATMAAGLSGMSSDQLDDVSALANPFGAAGAAAAMAFGAPSSDALLVGKTGSLLSQVPGALSFSAYSNWSKTQLALQQLGLSTKATTTVRIVGELGAVYDKASFVADSFSLGSEYRGLLSSDKGDIHSEMGFKSGDLGGGDLNNDFADFLGHDQDTDHYAGKGSLLGDKDLTKDVGGFDNHDNDGPNDSDFGGDPSDGFDGSGYDGGYSDHA